MVKNGGKKSAILSLVVDSTNVYGTGYTYGTGNFEGVYAASVTDGTIRWLQDCHGDVYGAAPIGDLVYSVGHAHYCSNIGGFPDTNPRSAYYRAIAVSKSAAGTVGKNGQTSSSTYTNFQGKPAPALFNWFPDLSAGSFTGMTQAAWSVVGNGTYISLGGEFPKVNGVAQQGLARMAIPSKAPRKIGPQLSGATTTPTAQLQPDGAVAVSWPANWDRDDIRLTYRLSRNGTVIDTQTVTAPFWARPTLTFVDSAAAATGYPTATYAVTVTDPDGNAVTTPSVTVTLPAVSAERQVIATSTDDHDATATEATPSGTAEAQSAPSRTAETESTPSGDQPETGTTPATSGNETAPEGDAAPTG